MKNVLLIVNDSIIIKFIVRILYQLSGLPKVKEIIFIITRCMIFIDSLKLV